MEKKREREREREKERERCPRAERKSIITAITANISA